ncbi:MAG: LysE family transporter [Saprospirales bacterium]|jgi:threonine/homoserine/homoserine lactone efflux protein|nr:LysE family transporter [Saprospirales bacterium]
MLLLLAGLFLSLTGSLPPGLISLSVAQTSILRGFWSAIVLALGASVAEFFQAWGALVFAGWFLDHPAAAKGFQIAAVPVFLGLAIYLWYFARPPRAPEVEVPIAPFRQFGRGVLISVFNLLAIPYWVAYAGWLRVNGWWQEGRLNAMLFGLGVTLGTMIALALYAWLAQELTRRSDMFAKVVNRFVALIFLGLGLKLVADLLL